MMKKKYILPWLFSFAVLVGLSYSWHAVFLNDLKILHYPVPLFILLLSVVYLVVSGVITFAISYVPTKWNYMTHGGLLGMAAGFIVYLVVYTLGVSFTGKAIYDHVLVDFGWQMFEEGIGGVVSGGIYGMLLRVERFNTAH